MCGIHKACAWVVPPGQDATEAFEDVGHSFQAQLAADEYIIGRVKGATEIRKCKRDTAGYSSHLVSSCYQD